jgi:hypothetical protein
MSANTQKKNSSMWLLAGGLVLAAAVVTPGCYVETGPIYDDGIDGVIEIGCFDNYDCTLDTWCVVDDLNADSWCAYSCLSDNDCGPAGCCLDTEAGGLCHPRRACGEIIDPTPDGGTPDANMSIDTGSTDGDFPVDASSDGGSADGSAGDGGPVDGGSADGGDAGPADGGAADGGAGDGGPADGGAGDAAPADGGSPADGGAIG